MPSFVMRGSLALVLACGISSSADARSTKTPNLQRELDKLFQQDDPDDLALSAGIQIAAAIVIPSVVGAIGGTAVGQSLGVTATLADVSATQAISGIGTNLLASQVGQAAATFAAYELGVEPWGAQLIGGATTGAVAGFFDTAVKPNVIAPGSFLSDTAIGSVATEWPRVTGTLLSAGKATVISGAQIGSYEALKAYDFDSIAGPGQTDQIANLSGAFLGNLGFSAASGAVGFNYSSAGEGLRKAFEDSWKPFTAELTGVAAFTVAAAHGLGTPYSTTLGATVAAAMDASLKDMTFKGAIFSGLLGAGVSVGVNAIGGQYDTNGRNRYGMTPLQWSTVEFGASSLVRGVTEGAFADKKPVGVIADTFMQTAKDLTYFGSTSPRLIGKDGVNTWTEAQALMKQMEFSGISQLYANADRIRAATGASWDELRKQGLVGDLLPDFTRSLINHTSSTLDSAAADNFTASLMALGASPAPAPAK